MQKPQNVLFKINLTLASVLVILLLINVPFYKNWMDSNIFNPAFDIVGTSQRMSIEERFASRFGSNYLVCKEMTDYFKKAGLKDALVLLPPEALVRELKIPNLSIPEPSIFYYYTGWKAVWYDSPEVGKANMLLDFTPDKKPTVRRIKDSEDLNRILTRYKKYKLEL